MVFLGALAFLACFPCLQGGFVFIDDEPLLINNPTIYRLSPENLSRIFWEANNDFFMPLVYFSYAVEFHFFGLNPAGYHATNLFFHIANTLFVYLIFVFMTRNAAVSFLTALLFGIHPLKAESVAWISGRKDLLSAFFYLGSFLYFLKHLISPKNIFYLFSLLLFLLSLLSKPTTATAPLVFLPVIFYMRKKIEKRDVLLLGPFILLSLFFGFFAWSQMRFLVPSRGQFDFLEYGFVLFRGLAFYLEKLLIPAKLCCMYYFPNQWTYLSAWQTAAILIAVALLFSAVFYSTKHRTVLFGASFFFLTLLPTLHLSYTRGVVADRYAYLPSLGIFFLISAAVDSLKNKSVKWPLLRAAGTGVLAAALLATGFLMWHQCMTWKNSLALTRQALFVDPGNQRAVLIRGNHYKAAGNYKQAAKDYRTVLSMKRRGIYWVHPSESYNNLGTLFFEKKNYRQAERCYRKSIEALKNFDPTDFGSQILLGELPFHNLGSLYELHGKYFEAVRYYDLALRINPRSWKSWFRRGDCYFKLAAPVES